MNNETLDSFSDGELHDVIARAKDLLEERQKRRKKDAIERAAKILKEAGVDLDELQRGRKTAARGPIYRAGRAYRHPDDKGLVWNAKGQKPNWLRDLEGQGVKAVEIAPGDNSRSGAADSAAISKSV